jgi:hypothetical protein
MIMNVWSCTEADTISLAGQENAALVMDNGEQQQPARVKQELVEQQQAQHRNNSVDGPVRSQEDLTDTYLVGQSAVEMTGFLAQDLLAVNDSSMLTLLDTNVTLNGSDSNSSGGVMQQRPQQQQRESIIVNWAAVATADTLSSRYL